MPVLSGDDHQGVDQRANLVHMLHKRCHFCWSRDDSTAAVIRIQVGSSRICPLRFFNRVSKLNQEIKDLGVEIHKGCHFCSESEWKTLWFMNLDCCDGIVKWCCSFSYTVAFRHIYVLPLTHTKRYIHQIKLYIGGILS